METDTTNYLNLSICLFSLLSVHCLLVWYSNFSARQENKKPIKKKKRKSN